MVSPQSKRKPKRVRINTEDVTYYERPLDKGSVQLPIQRKKSNAAMTGVLAKPISWLTKLIHVACALRLALELSVSVGSHTTQSNGDSFVSWPVVWDNDSTAYLFTPRPNGVKYIDEPGNPYLLNRSVAMLVLRSHWGLFNHSGAEPQPQERELVYSIVGNEAAVGDVAETVADFSSRLYRHICALNFSQINANI
jgi:hypothetical protein